GNDEEDVSCFHYRHISCCKLRGGDATGSIHYHSSPISRSRSRRIFADIRATGAPARPGRRRHGRRHQQRTTPGPFRYRRAPAYVDRVLKGEKPTAGASSELVINLKTSESARH